METILHQQLLNNQEPFEDISKVFLYWSSLTINIIVGYNQDHTEMKPKLQLIELSRAR